VITAPARLSLVSLSKIIPFNLTEDTTSETTAALASGDATPFADNEKIATDTKTIENNFFMTVCFYFFYFLFTIQSNIICVAFVLQTLYIIMKKLLQKAYRIVIFEAWFPVGES
jgi:hypothetical protein